MSGPGDDLLFNPRATILLEKRRGVLQAVTTLGPVKGEHLRRSRALLSREPALVEALGQVARGAGALELSGEVARRLAEMGLLIPPASVPAPVLFEASPAWGPQMETLVPPHLRAGLRPPDAPLMVAPSLRFRDAPGPPAEIPGARPGTPSPFAPGAASATVRPEGAAVPVYLTLGEAERATFRRLVPGEPPPADLDGETRAALFAAGVLVDPRAATRARAVEDAAERLERARAALLRDLVHPALLAALRRYYRALIAEGYVELGDQQVKSRYALHGEPMARVIHHELRALVSAVAGEPMKPSYAYFIAYLPGAELRPHTDRPQCELTISLLIDESPEPEPCSAWPLLLETPEGAIPITMRLGDGLLFRGRELSHFRRPLREGIRTSGILFHFVPETFEGPLD